MFKSPVDVVAMIAFNYSIDDEGEKENQATRQVQDVAKILRCKRKSLTLQHKEALNVAGFDADNQYEIGHEMSWKNQVFKSTSSKITKSIDYFVELVDHSVVSIDSFIQLNGVPHVFVKNYDILKTYNHLKSIKVSQNDYRLISYESIHRKLIYLKYTYSRVSQIEIVTNEPNRYEGN